MRCPDLTIMLSPPALLHADRIGEAGYRLISVFNNNTANVTILRPIEADPRVPSDRRAACRERPRGIVPGFVAIFARRAALALLRAASSQVPQHHSGTRSLAVKRLIRPSLGFKRLRTAWRTLVGHETLAMMRKGQEKAIGGHDIFAQAAFVNALLDVAA